MGAVAALHAIAGLQGWVPPDDDDDDRGGRRPPRPPKPEPPAARPPGADIVRDLVKDVKEPIAETDETMQP